MSTTAKQLDREIAENYLGRYVTADVPRIGPSQRIRGLATKVDASLAGSVMLRLDLPKGSHEHVLLAGGAPEVPRASRRGHR